MSPSLDPFAVAPDLFERREPLLRYFEDCRLSEALLELVNLRVSQINGCGYCVDKHARALRDLGRSERFVSTVVVWWESPFFTEREQTALAWAEAVTRLDGRKLPERLHEAVADQFTDRELVELTVAVALMNAWNRISIPFHREIPDA